LAEPAHTLWLALDEGEAVGYMRSQPAPHDVALVVADPQTLSITGAYTRPAWRGRGIASALLGRIVHWADTHGYTRCAVDFEAQNPLGSRLWLKHFQPVCHSLIRRVDERIAEGAWGRGIMHP
jgi:GNAT superfamily N-acetyltransferase